MVISGEPAAGEAWLTVGDGFSLVMEAMAKPVGVRVSGLGAKGLVLGLYTSDRLPPGEPSDTRVLSRGILEGPYGVLRGCLCRVRQSLLRHVGQTVAVEKALLKEHTTNLSCMMVNYRRPSCNDD